MTERVLVVSSKKGLHARPAAAMVELLNKYSSQVKIVKDDYEIDGKSIMGVLILAAGPGTELKFIVEGVDEAEALEAVAEFFRTNFGEINDER